MPALLRLKVHAGSREDRVERLTDTHFEVWVKAKAEAGRANAAVLSLLAASLRLSAKRLRIAKGARTPNKIVAILGT